MDMQSDGRLWPHVHAGPGERARGSEARGWPGGLLQAGVAGAHPPRPSHQHEDAGGRDLPVLPGQVRGGRGGGHDHHHFFWGQVSVGMG